MQVRAEFAFRALALHGGDNLVADDKAADIGTAGFLDEFLHQDVGFQAHKGFNHRLGRFAGFRQHHTNALGTLQQFDDHRRATHHLQQLRHVVRFVGKPGYRHAHALTGQQLQGTQFVPGTGNGYRFVERKYTHHLELAQYRGAVKRHRGADSRNHHIEVFQHFFVVMDQRVGRRDVHGAMQRVNHLHFMATIDAFLHQATGGIEVTVS